MRGSLGGVLHEDDELHDEGDAQVPEEDEGREYPPELEALDLSCRKQTTHTISCQHPSRKPHAKLWQRVAEVSSRAAYANNSSVSNQMSMPMAPECSVKCQPYRL